MQTISLTNSDKVATVDDADFDTLSQYSWRLHKVRHSDHLEYAVRAGNNQTQVFMHRQLTVVTKGQSVDHANGDGLDNRQTNLRVCTHAENMRNRKAEGWGRSSFKGVYFEKNKNRWAAQLVLNGKKIRKYFKTELEAARHYNILATKFFGVFAKPNLA
jgi:hypothetical protein